MPHPYLHITPHCFVNAPFDWLRKNLSWVIANRLQPEIGLEGEVLYRYGVQEFSRIAAALKQAGLACTIHAPFADLSPGAADPHIRAATLNKLKLAFALLPVFRPLSIVCHLNYDPVRHAYNREAWFEHSLATWRELLTIAVRHRTPMMLENTYEQNPAMHQQVLHALDSPHARFCLDVGHTLAFAHTPWQEWLPTLTPWLGQLHLHDNHGDHDAHLPIGAGCFDFKGLFSYLETRPRLPLITLEPHEKNDLFTTLAGLDRFNLFSRRPSPRT